MPHLIKFQPLLEGILTFFPWWSMITTKATGGTDSARYCYSVWLRHIIKTRPFKPFDSIRTILELGPGDSLGIGLCALLSGIKNYIAFDVKAHSEPIRNRAILSELIDLFSEKNPIPNGNEFPDIKPYLDKYEFPKWLSDYLPEFSNIDITPMLEALKTIEKTPSPIRYITPETADKKLPSNSVDLIYSQAVLEHVDDLEPVYKNCLNWLSPGGIMSHQIDFRSHGTALVWNGHWTYSSLLWRMMRGRRPYLINREPLSTHLRLMREAGFEIILVERHKTKSNLKTKQLAKAFSNLDQDDLTTSGAYIIAQKPCEVT
jgi:SAM-dependent methyltransferase